MTRPTSLGGGRPTLRWLRGSRLCRRNGHREGAARRAQSPAYSSIIEEIAAKSTDRARYAQLRHLYQNNLPAVEQSLQLRLGPQGLYEQDAMTLAALSDVLHPVAPDALNAGLETARARNVRIFEAEILRAIGLFAPDRAALAEAHSIFAAASALPFEARTRCELALIDGDRASFDAASPRSSRSAMSSRSSAT